MTVLVLNLNCFLNCLTTFLFSPFIHRSRKHKNKRKKEYTRQGSNSLSHSASFHSSHSESNYGTELSYPTSKSLSRRPHSIADSMYSGTSYFNTTQSNTNAGYVNRIVPSNNGPHYPKPPPPFANDTSTPNVYSLKSHSAVHFGVYGENESDIDADISSSTNPVSAHSPAYPQQVPGRYVRCEPRGLRSRSCVDVSDPHSDHMLQERINLALARSLTFKDGAGDQLSKNTECGVSQSNSTMSHPLGVSRSQTLNGTSLASEQVTYKCFDYMKVYLCCY